jgi:adenine-specific DNA-methyltransferase
MSDTNFIEKVGQVDTIYIDPPYNTRSKFSYKDKKEHDEWLVFMRVRLEKAKELLKETGIIFLSIDDNEFAYLKVLCDEVFYRKNFLGTFITYQSQRSNAKHINTVHEYVLCYAKDKSKASGFKIKRTSIPEDRQMIEKIVKEVKEVFTREGQDEAQKELSKLIKRFCEERNITWLRNYSNVDDKGRVYFSEDLSTPGKPRRVDIPEIDLTLEPLSTRGWSSDAKFKELYAQNKLVFKKGRPYEKHLLIDSEENASSILSFYSRQGSNDLNKLGLRDLFDTPKPVELIKYLVRISTPENGTVLDFFAGSGTTGQAVYEVNFEDSSDRKFVLIQLDEQMNETSKSYKACLNLGITPIISEALIYRVNAFREQNDIRSDDLKIERN